MSDIKVSATMFREGGEHLTHVLVVNGDKVTTSKIIPTHPSQIREERTSLLWQPDPFKLPPSNRGGISFDQADRMAKILEARRLKDEEHKLRYGK